MFERDIDICHETVRIRWNRFGPMFAAKIGNRRVFHGSHSNRRWHLDEVFVRIDGETHDLWRAVSQEGEVLEVLATNRRDRTAALRLHAKPLSCFGRVASTGGLRVAISGASETGSLETDSTLSQLLLPGSLHSRRGINYPCSQ